MRVSRIQQARRRRRGAAVVETAVVLNVLLLMVLGIFEYGRLVMIRQLMLNAAREGARMAVVGTASNPPATTSQIQAAATAYLIGQPLSSLAVSVYQADPATGNSIGAWDQTPYGGALVVKISGNYKPVIASTFGIVPNPMPLQAVVMMLSEAN
ncbi:MAG: TadE/TadG family type IV pilus assembly protein [Paludisphaera borealis]|uniref:TadE/TadG family type IV pilus assembly protein n=1 Tax=Paludisphaera borealis TaxID=1387353 RepID=UPI00284C8299|nr:TadE/TadG family type IV pilus assembly protein [Paludisphaera borealis]MDR3621802.1 TadE/TadG family type IV pilus assembly protein [Paludisphaera borealis]